MVYSEFILVDISYSSDVLGRIYSNNVRLFRKNIQSEISNDYEVRVTNFSLYLPKYRGTKELEKFIEINQNSGLF